MRRARMLVLAATTGATLAMPAMAVGAPSWHVASKGLKTGEAAAFATSPVIAEKPVLEISELGVVIKCAGIDATGEIIGTSSGKAGLEFTGCKEEEPAGCSVTGTISTQPLSLTAREGASVGMEGKLEFLPQSGTTFASIDFTGASCSVAGEKAARGKIAAAVPRLREELTEQEVRADPSEETEVSGNLTVRSRFKLKLASGATWSFRS
jgi:hypothetical protein